jgi:ankyrin repeat protein
VAIFDETLPTILEFPSRIDVNIIDNMKWAAVHFPGMRFENLRRLVNAGADIELQNDRGDTALGAVSGHDLQKVQFLVKRGANINHKSPWYGSPLHQACRTPDFDIIKFLIEKGADINSTCNSGYGTPLQSLCMKRTILSSLEHEEMVEYLLSGHEKQRPDVTAKAGTLGYAINAAALCGTPAIINLILEQEGGTVNVRDDMGRMPLHFAAISGIPNFEAILQKGGDIYAKDNTGRTALHWAAQVGRLQVVEKIISLMDDKTAVDAPDIDGWTPLCWAARGIGSWLDQSHASEPSSDVPTIKLLLENGADRNVVVALGDEKWTPLKIARYCRTNSDVVSLITHGIRPEVEEGQGASEGPPSTNTKQETKGKEEPRMKLGILYDARYCDVCQCVSPHSSYFFFYGASAN